jgi:hypothetical protein
MEEEMSITSLGIVFLREDISQIINNHNRQNSALNRSSVLRAGFIQHVICDHLSI